MQQRYDVELTTVGALGVSAMMHDYLAFDADGELLTSFWTWRNANTGQAAEWLSAEFGHNIPHRWSVAHLYQAILSGEDHVPRVAPLTTLAGYVHWQLTGEREGSVSVTPAACPRSTAPAAATTPRCVRPKAMLAQAYLRFPVAPHMTACSRSTRQIDLTA